MHKLSFRGRIFFQNFYNYGQLRIPESYFSYIYLALGMFTLTVEGDGRQEIQLCIFSEQKSLRDRSCSREASCGPSSGHRMSGPPPPHTRGAMGHQQSSHMGGGGGNDLSAGMESGNGPTSSSQQPPPPQAANLLQPRLLGPPSGLGGCLPHNNSKNGLVKFNRNVEKDIFGYYCLSFLNDDGEISEKKVRTDFSKFGEVVSVRGALGKQKGHVFVRFRKKEAAENCLNCLNSFPLSEMSELFGRYLFLSPATPRDIDCDMYGLYR